MPSERIMPSREAAELRHTLRTPINHIIGYAELLLEDVGPAEPSAQILNKLLGIAQQTLAVVQKHLQTTEPDLLSPDLIELRKDLAAPVAAAVDQVDELLKLESGSRLSDAERIGLASQELRKFVNGEPVKPIGRSPLSSNASLRDTGMKLLARFLIVDDSDLSREMLCRLLERQGHTCIALGSGSEALDRLRSEPFDMVLLDVMMPGMNGLDVLQAIKSDEALAQTAVVMLSALDETDDIGLCLQVGAEDYLLKPFDRIILNARLNAVLERKRLQNLERRRTIQLEEADAELRRSNDELRRFASVVSHDLQEPLRMVTTYMQLLKRDLGAGITQTQTEYLDFAIDGGRRMSALIHDLLEYSRIAAGDLHSEWVDCNEVLEDVKVSLRAAIADSKAVITNSELPRIQADSSQIRQLFQNLLSNAIKYRADRPPCIEVSARKQNEQWLFSVKDNGQGIDKEHTDRIFQMFLRLHDRTVPGTGIGLAICQRVVERLGGKIWVESELDRGSTFFFTIPL